MKSNTTMKNKIFISSKLQELIAFLKKELKKPVTILEPKDYERPITKRIDIDPKSDNPTNGGFVAYLDQYHAHNLSDCTIQKRSQ